MIKACTMQTHLPNPQLVQSQPQSQRGSALIMSLFLTIFAFGIVMSGTSILKSNRARTETVFLLTGQAAQFARSGLTEAINWFRRQPNQPVTLFAPVLDTVADPQVLDTEDSDIGLVRQFRIHASVWGRYEVWKQWDADPDPDRLIWRQQMQAEDVSLSRGRTVTGGVWRLRCVGYVFDQRDPTKTFREYPNRVMATEVLEAEISRLALALPGQSAICCRTGDGISIKNKGKVFGGSDAAGLYYPNSTGTPSVTGSGEVTGTPDMAGNNDYDDSVTYVFGVNDEGLRSMADNYVTAAADFPDDLPDNSITVLEDNIVFDSSEPMDGSGIVVIRGDVTIKAGTSTFFSGLLYVDGDLTLHAPCTMKGAIVVTGDIAVQGVGEFTEIYYDDKVLNNLAQTLASYRLSRSARRRADRD